MIAAVGLEIRGRVPVASVTGEVDLFNADLVRDRIATAVTPDAPGIVIDLSATEYLDSAGVRMLFELAERIQGRRQQLRLVVRDQAIIRRVVALTTLDRAVPLDESVGAAVAAID